MNEQPTAVGKGRQMLRWRVVSGGAYMYHRLLSLRRGLGEAGGGSVSSFFDARRLMESGGMWDGRRPADECASLRHVFWCVERFII